MAVRDGGRSRLPSRRSMRASETVEAPVSPTKTSLVGFKFGLSGETKSRPCSKTSGRRCSSACAVLFDPDILQPHHPVHLVTMSRKRLAAALRDSPHKTTAPPPACEDHRNAIPAASLPPWE